MVGIEPEVNKLKTVFRKIMKLIYTQVKLEIITKTSLFKYTENYNQKIENFQIKILIFFLFLLKNKDCGYSKT